MWYIFLRAWSDTWLISSSNYNSKIQILLEKLTFASAEFAFYANESNFVNVSKLIEPIQEFLEERKYWYSEDEEQFAWINELEEELRFQSNEYTSD